MKKRICKNCGNIILNLNKLFCNMSCKREFEIKERIENKKHPVKFVNRYNQIKAKCKKNEIKICNKDNFINHLINLNKACEYCGITEKFIKEKGKRIKTLTIDRKDPKKGYVPDNMTFACIMCNSVKSNIFSYDEMREIGRKYMINKRECI